MCRERFIQPLQICHGTSDPKHVLSLAVGNGKIQRYVVFVVVVVVVVVVVHTGAVASTTTTTVVAARRALICCRVVLAE